MVSPYLPGLDEDELALESLLNRAANAGARFAGVAPLQFGPGQRENFLSHVTALYPESATKFRRIIGRRAMTDEELMGLREQFHGLCTRLGLEPLDQAAAPRHIARRSPAQQLTLFSLESMA